MPVRNPVTCKAILDEGAAATSELQAAANLMMALGSNILEGTVADTPEGVLWAEKVVSFHHRVKRHGERLKLEAMELCASQPVA